MSTQEVIAGHLQAARYALEHGTCYGQTIDVNLRHPQRPNGCPARLRIAVDPGMIVCRAFNTGKDHALFPEAVKSLFAFTSGQMRGWAAAPGSSGTSGGKVHWRQMSYAPPSLVTAHSVYAELFYAVSEARTACLNHRRFRTTGTGEWQSADTANGKYPVAWGVAASGNVITIRLKNRGPDSMTFMALARWVFNRIRDLHPDARTLDTQPRGLMLAVFSDTLRLEVPTRHTI